MAVKLATLIDIRRARDTVSPGSGRKPLYHGKAKFLHYLTPVARDELATLAKAAGVNQSDFLEILIRRYGRRTAVDILTALGNPNEDKPTVAKPGA